MIRAWDVTSAGVLQLPSGRLLRGRALRNPTSVQPDPELAVYLLGVPPPETDWESRWVRWPDFRLPTDRAAAAAAFREAWSRAAAERVEIGCSGGHGRTGTALACLAILDGVPPATRWRSSGRTTTPARSRRRGNGAT